MAPEMFTGEHNEKCDVWSAGVILFILLCGYPPFTSDDDYTLQCKIVDGTYNIRSKSWSYISQEVIFLYYHNLKG